MNRFACVLGLLLSLAGCKETVNQNTVPLGAKAVRSSLSRADIASVPPGDIATAAHDNATFGFNTYRAADKGAGNFVFSPLSISEALAMTYAGANGATATQMATALNFSLPAERLHPAFNAIDQKLTQLNTMGTSGGFDLQVSNQIWGEIDTTFETPFLDTLAVNYGAGLYTLDFKMNPDPSRVAINDWIASVTNGKIVDLLPQGSIDTDTRLVLTNAVYFKAAWETAFEASATSNETFTKADSSTTSVPFMHTTRFAEYAETTAGKLVILPYDGAGASMIFLLPNDYAALDTTIDDSVLTAATTATRYNVTLSVPKFEARSSFSLGAVLRSLGMVDAFSPAADFSPMDGARDLEINDVIHQAFIHVDEAGTEAAAATAVTVGTTDVEVGPSTTLDLNHPFYFFIRDNSTNTLIFAGRIVDPG